MIRFLSLLLTMVFLITVNVRSSGARMRTSVVPVRSAAQLFSKYCTSCHGKDGRAKTFKAKFNHARDFSDAKWQDDVTDERISNSITNGRNVRGKMPAFGKKMTEQEIDSLVTYVRSLRK